MSIIVRAAPPASLCAFPLNGLPVSVNPTERNDRIDPRVDDRGLICFADLMRELEMSRATLERDLPHLRDRSNAPIVLGRDTGGYRSEQRAGGPRIRLPGPWFSADECPYATGWTPLSDGSIEVSAWERRRPLESGGASTLQIATAGIGLATNVSQVHGVNERGKAELRKRLRRGRVAVFLANLPPCLLGMEACGAHRWARKPRAMGHAVKPVAPQVIKPYVKRNRNDAADAEAICEAVGRPAMRFVPRPQWRHRGRGDEEGDRSGEGFVPVMSGAPAPAPSSGASVPIHVHVRRGAVTVHVYRPVSAAAQCAAWLRRRRDPRTDRLGVTIAQALDRSCGGRGVAIRRIYTARFDCIPAGRPMRPRTRPLPCPKPTRPSAFAARARTT